MATFLVLKRVKEDWVSLPGELLIDPPAADILIARGYIIPVPDNYPGAVSKSPQSGPLPAKETDPPLPAGSPNPSDGLSPFILSLPDLREPTEAEREATYQSALAYGLSDAEAREEGWPSGKSGLIHIPRQPTDPEPEQPESELEPVPKLVAVVRVKAKPEPTQPSRPVARTRVTRRR